MLTACPPWTSSAPHYKIHGPRTDAGNRELLPPAAEEKAGQLLRLLAANILAPVPSSRGPASTDGSHLLEVKKHPCSPTTQPVDSEEWRSLKAQHPTSRRPSSAVPPTLQSSPGGETCSECTSWPGFFPCSDSLAPWEHVLNHLHACLRLCF